MKSIENLTEEDYIAFGFNYNGGEPDEIIVDKIENFYEDKVLVCFSYGYKSVSEFIKKEDILAIGNNEFGEGKIKGWKGKYDILDQEKIDKIPK